MIIALHVPCFIIIVYYWILSESVRWLLSKNKYPDAKKILETVARVNKTHISEKSMEALMNPPRNNVTTVRMLSVIYMVSNKEMISKEFQE